LKALNKTGNKRNHNLVVWNINLKLINLLEHIIADIISFIIQKIVILKIQRDFLNWTDSGQIC